MAALPYIQLYIADYLADTIHLETDEHGAYILLIFNYWQTAKPIPKNRLQSITKLSNERWTVVERSLNELFNDTGTHWQHDRIDDDLARVSAAQKQRSEAGKASARARQNNRSNGRSTSVQRAFNERTNGRSTNKDTDTDTDTDTDGAPPPPAHAHAREADGGDGDGERLPDFAELRGMLEAEGWAPLKLVRINSAIAGWIESRVTVGEFRHALETFRASPANAKRAPPANYLTSVIESTRLERAETFDTVSATASDTGDELTAEQVAAMWGEEPPETFERIDHSARIIDGETINTHDNKDKNQ